MQEFTGTYIERHILPAPVVYIELNCSKGLYRRIGIYILLFTIAIYLLTFHPSFAVLTTYGILVCFVFVDLPDGIQHIYLFISYLVGIKRYRRLHSHHAQQLEYVIL